MSKNNKKFDDIDLYIEDFESYTPQNSYSRAVRQSPISNSSAEELKEFKKSKDFDELYPSKLNDADLHLKDFESYTSQDSHSKTIRNYPINNSSIEDFILDKKGAMGSLLDFNDEKDNNESNNNITALSILREVSNKKKPNTSPTKPYIQVKSVGCCVIS